MRNVGLDLLRIVAVILVIGRHLHVPKDGSQWLKTWQTGGWVGVDLFFVLSGFLVSSLLFREYSRYGAVDIKRFLIRRAFKIYPAFWLLLAVTLIVDSWLDRFPRNRQILAELFFLQNYWAQVWNHTWSLAVEEHFYIGLAIIVAGLVTFQSKNPFRAIPTVFAVTAIACLGFRCMNLWLHPVYTHQAYLFGTHLRVDSLMFGVLLAYLWNFHQLEQKLQNIPTSLLVGLGAAMLTPAFVYSLETHKWVSVFGVILFYLGSGAILLASTRIKSTQSKLVSGLASLGAASYSIYLWHMAVGTWGYKLITKAIGTESYSVYLLVSVAGACVVGWLLNRMVEAPMLILRDRVMPSRSNALTAEEANDSGQPADSEQRENATSIETPAAATFGV